MSFQLRDYQQAAVEATLQHFRKSNESAVIVLPTGAGKSLVIAELARLAKRRILVLTHVKELVEQNHSKYEHYGLTAGIYAAGLKQKNTQYQVTFASIQSVARNLNDFSNHFSLVIIDECHRIKTLFNSESRISNTEINNNSTHDKHTQNSSNENNQYSDVLSHLKQFNSQLKVLGLTATPYRLDLGWVYQFHYFGIKRSDENAPFVKCIYELPLSTLIKRGYLTPPKQINAAVEAYDFQSIQTNNQASVSQQAVNQLIAQHPRVTEGICQHIINMATDRCGVMIFAATIEHANEILGYLATTDNQPQVALVTGKTSLTARAAVINAFKARQIKYLVNVSVLTTGFDAPHVDFIAILRPTQSVGLYQQIVGRGLRLSENKPDCLVIDYAGNGFDIFYPEVGFKKPNSDSQPVMIKCPQCDFANTFWGKVDNDNQVVEHYGRRCWGYDEFENERGVLERVQCTYRFKFKECPHCMEENDIAARRCVHCNGAIIDPDDQLRKALNLSNALVLRCAGMTLYKLDSQSIQIIYHDEDGTELSEVLNLSKRQAAKQFSHDFIRRLHLSKSTYLSAHTQDDNGRDLNRTVSKKALLHAVISKLGFNCTDDIVALTAYLQAPDFVIAYKDKKGGWKSEVKWKINTKLFDYEGHYRKANQLM